MDTLEQVINKLIPALYDERAKMMDRPTWIDMSHSNQCQPLTFDLMTALEYRGMPVRRELHKDDNGKWHYILAHTNIDSEPANNDIMTDVNPWQWTNSPRYSGPLHASRKEIMGILQEKGAPPYFIALRSLETIVRPHAPQK